MLRMDSLMIGVPLPVVMLSAECTTKRRPSILSTLPIRIEEAMTWIILSPPVRGPAGAGARGRGARSLKPSGCESAHSLTGSAPKGKGLTP